MAYERLTELFHEHRNHPFSSKVSSPERYLNFYHQLSDEEKRMLARNGLIYRIINQIGENTEQRSQEADRYFDALDILRGNNPDLLDRNLQMEWALEEIERMNSTETSPDQ